MATKPGSNCVLLIESGQESLDFGGNSEQSVC